MPSEKSVFEKKMQSINSFASIIIAAGLVIFAFTTLNIWGLPEHAENADATMLAMLFTQKQILFTTGYGLSALIVAAGYALKCLALTGMNNAKRPETLEN